MLLEISKDVGRFSLILKELKQPDSSTLSLIWDDGHEASVKLQTRRDACPCASRQEEPVFSRQIVPPEPDIDTPGRYELKAALPVGNYAVRFAWADGHNEGMYTWEYLRSLCECAECLKLRPARGNA